MHGVLRFLNAEGLALSAIYDELVAVYDEDIMSRKLISVLCTAFREGHMTFEDDPRLGRHVHRQLMMFCICKDFLMSISA